MSNDKSLTSCHCHGYNRLLSTNDLKRGFSLSREYSSEKPVCKRNLITREGEREIYGHNYRLDASSYKFKVES